MGWPGAQCQRERLPGARLHKHPRYYQQSVDRGFFYVFADKEGTQKDGAGQLCVDGNHVPCWVKAPRSSRYQVMGKWPLSLWQQHKLSHDTYEEYLCLCRDSVLPRKRNLDAVRQRDEEAAEAMERKATVKRVRATTFQAFTEVPEVATWQALFAQEVDRYPILVLLAPSRSRKTEYAKSLFKAPLELKIGVLEHFPEGMRRFSRQKHDAIILDDSVAMSPSSSAIRRSSRASRTQSWSLAPRPVASSLTPSGSTACPLSSPRTTRPSTASSCMTTTSSGTLSTAPS